MKDMYEIDIDQFTYDNNLSSEEVQARDVSLLRRVRRLDGDDDDLDPACWDITLNYKGMAIDLVNKYGNNSRMDKEELVHEALRYLYQRVPDYDQRRAKFVTFAYSVMRTGIMQNNLGRRATDGHARSLYEDDDDSREKSRDVVDNLSKEPWEEAYHSEKMRRLFGVIENLPEREKQVINGVYYRKDYKTIADEMGISRGQVDTLAQRAKKLIHQKIIELHGVEGLEQFLSG